MKKVTIIGAGMMTGPIADYLMDTCNYRVIMADRIVSKAQKIIAERPLGKAVELSVQDATALDNVVNEADIVISMVPKPLHTYVARSCLRCRKDMMTTSYETPGVLALADEAKEKGILFLNEIGEDPGLDHFGTQLILDDIDNHSGKVVELNTYGCGLPAFEHNNNPMGYKFSWDPRTVLAAAQTSAAYYKKGKRIEVPGNRLFEHFQLIEVGDIGIFETYPNKDCKKYKEYFGLDDHVSFYRGILRYSGYCNNMRDLNEIGLFDSGEVKNFQGVTYRQFTASLVGARYNNSLEKNVAEYLKLDINADFIHCFKWLGFFDEEPIHIKNGTNLDVLLEVMLKKMSYKPHEKDMIIVHIEALAEFPGKSREKRTATMHFEGIPYGASAMSRAVGLPMAVATRLVLEGKINAVGAHVPPTLPGLYQPVLHELANLGFVFNKKTGKR
jgi:saccharopine dehydrogenase-like NADP-dependent oxidoreductase